MRCLSVSLTKNNQRLTYYTYPNEWQGFEFYDLVDDPGELQNLYGQQPKAAVDMKEELMQRLSEANAPFQPASG